MYAINPDGYIYKSLSGQNGEMAGTSNIGRPCFGRGGNAAMGGLGGYGCQAYPTIATNPGGGGNGNFNQGSQCGSANDGANGSIIIYFQKNNIITTNGIITLDTVTTSNTAITTSAVTSSTINGVTSSTVSDITSSTISDVTSSTISDVTSSTIGTSGYDDSNVIIFSIVIVIIFILFTIIVILVILLIYRKCICFTCFNNVIKYSTPYDNYL